MPGQARMLSYRLTLDAEDDLLGIAIYTIETWGLDQADRYEAALVQCFETIADRSARTRAPIPHRPELRVCRCEHHYVFALQEEGSPTLILAVFHEKMDLMVRLRERLEDE